MNKLLATLLLALLWTWLPPGLAAAKDTPLHARVVLSGNAAPYLETLRGFRDHLEKQLPGTRISEYFLPPGAPPASDMLAPDADLYLALGAVALHALRERGVGKPVVAGMVMSAEELTQAGNVSGVVLELPLETELEWMRRMLPDKQRIGLLYSREPVRARIDAASRLIAASGKRLHARAVPEPQLLPGALRDLENEIDFLWGVADPVVYTPQTAKEILLYSFRNRIPMIGLSHAWVKGGALYALDRDYHDIGAQCGELLQAVAAGAGQRPRVVHPRKVVYSINLKTARHMKIELDAALVRGAAEVVE